MDIEIEYATAIAGDSITVYFQNSYDNGVAIATGQAIERIRFSISAAGTPTGMLHEKGTASVGASLSMTGAVV